MVVEVGRIILAHVFCPEWIWGVKILFREFRECFQLLGVGAIEQPPKPVYE